MIAHYGYKDGSGEYFISIDSNKCTGCEKCIPACPGNVLEMITDDYDDTVAAVTDEQRRKIKYTCMQCKPSTGERDLPCVNVCEPVAIVHSW